MFDARQAKQEGVEREWHHFGKLKVETLTQFLLPFRKFRCWFKRFLVAPPFYRNIKLLSV